MHGNIENKGIELAVNGSPVKTKTFNWVSAFNISHNESKIKALYPGLKFAAAGY